MGSIDPERTPVVLATGQSIERDEMLRALDLAERAAESALSQVPALRDRIQRLSLVNILSRVGPAPASLLARRLGLAPERAEVTTIGGNSPQTLVNKAASAIAAGKLQATLIVGGEAQRSSKLRRSQKHDPSTQDASASPGSSDGGSLGDSPELPPDPITGDDRPGMSTAEMNAGLIAPVHIYPLFESVLAARAGRTFAEQRRFLGELMARFTEVAAKHPFAWFPESATPAELSDTGPDNRLVAEPYPKRMCAFLNVDQGAAVIVCSLAAARDAGVEDQAVFCLSGADTTDVWFPAQRPDPGTSPAIAAAGAGALGAAGIDIDDIAAFDLYSCFPCAVELGANALGIALDDPRGLTVTGGLPYFGGPGNNYTLHAIATMVDQIRDSGQLGLVTGLGWYATKHSVGIYGPSAPDSGWRQADTDQAQAEIDASEVELAEGLDAEQDALVVASTVIYGPDGTATGAPLVARLRDGRHVAAALAPGEEAAQLAGRNLVGESVRVSGTPPKYRLA